MNVNLPGDEDPAIQYGEFYFSFPLFTVLLMRSKVLFLSCWQKNPLKHNALGSQYSIVSRKLLNPQISVQCFADNPVKQSYFVFFAITQRKQSF